MFTVFARTFLTATRVDAPVIRDAPKPNQSKKEWLPDSHWWKEPLRDVDLNDR